MAEVKIENVSKIYAGGVTAVNNASLVVKDREFLVLVGPSGCGKSTLLRMIAGLEEISAGTIRIGDRVVNGVAPKDRDIAMVFQDYALYPHMTVYDNMAFGLKMRRYPKEDIRIRVREAAQILDLENLLDRLPKQLSGGQRQRVAVGRAIVRKPAAFLFDEPLSNLDAKLRVEMRAELKRLHARLRTTMVYVTHDQVEAMTLGERIVVLRDGIMQQVGEPLDLYDRPANRFVAGFLGTPPINLLSGRIESRGGARVFCDGQADIRLADKAAERLDGWDGQAVDLGVRPESIEVLDSSADGLEACVEVVEPLGNETVVFFKTGGHSLVAMVAPHRRIRPGDILRLNLPPDRLHVFDKTTGRNLTVADAGGPGP